MAETLVGNPLPSPSSPLAQAGQESGIPHPAPTVKVGRGSVEGTAKSRISRIGGSLAIVVLAYCAYAWLAVPWIEPPADALRIQRLTKEERDSAQRALTQRVEELKPLFRAGDWELNTPKILEMDNAQVKLLWQTYDTKDGRSYEIKPCTLVYTPDDPADNPAERIRRSVVLQAPQGAVLQFDKAFDLLRGKPEGRVRGELRGSVTIRSAGKGPGEGDDLLVVTQNVRLSDDRIGTTDPVEFRWGNSYGRGTNLQISLLQDETPGSAAHTPKITGIDWIEIRRIERLHLEFDPRQSGSAPPLAAAPQGLQKASAAEPVILEVTARGPLHFSVAELRAKLQDQVNVLQLHRNGPSDQLTCETLAIDFARRRAGPSKTPEAGTAKAADSVALADLQPQRIEADGNPVTVHAPSREFQARGERIEYDFWSGRIFLKGTPEAFLQQGPNEIHAPSFQYQPGEDPRLAQGSAPGPGWLRGQMGDRPDQQFEARWTGQLSVQPVDQQQVISMTGGAQVTSPGFGRLSAGQIHLWLLQMPSSSGQRAAVRPDRMSALQQVRLDSPHLSGTVEERLDIWFKEPDPAQDAARQQKVKQEGIAARVQSQLEQAQLAAQLAKTFSGTNPAGSPAAPNQPGSPAPSAGATGQPGEDAAPKNHFEVAARRLQALVTMRGTQPEPSELTVEGSVRLAETITEQPNQRPIVITGDQIHVMHAAQPYAAATIIGRPARFQGQGVTMSGANINVNRGQNRLWIDGAGEMDVLIDRDLEGRPLASAGPLNVQWQQGMNFDGKTASFNGSVLAHVLERQLQTDVLKATFQRLIRFADAGTQPRPELERIACEGAVVTRDRTIDASGQTSQTQVETSDLVIQTVTGQVTANGPGSMTDTRRGASGLGMLGGPAPGTSTPPSAPKAPADSKQLHYLNVRFQRGISGNLHERTVTFHHKVQAIYGPVASWEDRLNPTDPNGPKPGCTMLTADNLRVADMPVPSVRDRSAVELAAQGNAVAQGTTLAGATFTARANQILYAQAKDQLILDWDGTTYAELFFQKTVGGQPFRYEAQKIIFYPSTMKTEIEGHHYMELQQPASPR